LGVGKNSTIPLARYNSVLVGAAEISKKELYAQVKKLQNELAFVKIKNSVSQPPSSDDTGLMPDKTIHLGFVFASPLLHTYIDKNGNNQAKLFPQLDFRREF
jgi:hypothetical protein